MDGRIIKIIKRWFGLKWNPDLDSLLDVEENDKGELRIKKAGDKWGSWQTKDIAYFNVKLIESLKTTTPSEDYTKPTKDQIDSIDAFKKWKQERGI